MNADEEFKMIREVVRQIQTGSFLDGITDELFKLDCNNLKQDAEIFLALHPGQAIGYILERKFKLYEIMTEPNPMRLGPAQQAQLEFVQRCLYNLYGFFCVKLDEIKNL